MMKRCIKASLTSGLVGIWRVKDNEVFVYAVPLDEGYNDGSFIYHADSIISKRYKSLDRGRVVYNLRTQCYEVTCGDAIFNDIDKRQLIIDTFQLAGCRYDFINLGTHYHIAELTGNLDVDRFEYEV